MRQHKGTRKKTIELNYVFFIGSYTKHTERILYHVAIIGPEFSVNLTCLTHFSYIPITKIRLVEKLPVISYVYEYLASVNRKYNYYTDIKSLY